MLEVTCSDKHLIETWSLPMGDNNRIKIIPTKLSHEDRNTRIRYGAKVMGLEKEIGLKDVHSLLTESNAKEWFFNTHHELVIYFQFGKDKDRAIRTPFKINDKPYIWLQDSRGQQPFRESSTTGRWNIRFRQISQGKDTIVETEPTNSVEDIKTETITEVPVLAMDIKMLIDMLDKVVIEDTINNNNDKIRADNIETTEMDIDKEITP
ncbi:unnamed protein product [Rhizophagus irregularis]|nr:unnamed protein product [Rhizophagus irregularis]